MERIDLNALVQDKEPEIRALYARAEELFVLFEKEPVEKQQLIITNKNAPQESKLVTKVAPTTVVGRPQLPQEQAAMANFIADPALRAQEPPKDAQDETESVYEIKSYQSFYLLVKDKPELKTEKEIVSLVQIMDSIPKSCGCVRGALNESANGTYSHMLPMIQARNPAYFDLLKQHLKVSKLIFKEGPLVLLIV